MNVFACKFESYLSEAFTLINLREKDFHFSSWKPSKGLDLLAF